MGKIEKPPYVKLKITYIDALLSNMWSTSSNSLSKDYA
jgi:hypothetical protein